MSLLRLFDQLLTKGIEQREADALELLPTSKASKNKWNVPSMIYNMLILIHQKEYDYVISQSDNLQKYIYRHLNEAGAERTKAFLKLLIYLCRFNYDTSTINKINQLQRKLSQYTQTEGRIIEVIPYETIWKVLVDYLQRTNADKFSPLTEATMGKNAQNLSRDRSTL
jgi:hypothetical protein